MPPIHRREFAEAPIFRPIERDRARGLRRYKTPGVAAGLGRRTAIADLWQDNTERVLARFSTAREIAWFTVDWDSDVGRERWERDEWDVLLHPHLIAWLVEVMDDQYGD